MANQNLESDKVSHILKFCIEDHELAKKVYQNVIIEKNRKITLPDGEVTLSEEECGEFVKRFSDEVEPTMWKSKRAKD